MTESFKFYEVGGKIRDELLGLKSEDVDYVAVPTNELLYKDYTAEEMFKLLYADLAMVEECSELTNAICKFRRGRVNEDDIITEIADVMIMCEQMAAYFGKDKVALEKENKLERLEERLAKYEWEQEN